MIPFDKYGWLGQLDSQKQYIHDNVQGARNQFNSIDTQLHELQYQYQQLINITQQLYEENQYL